MIAQSGQKSTRDTYNYGQYLNSIPPNTIKVIREFERIQKKICRLKVSIIFNEICSNEEMLPKYTYIYIYIYVCVCVCVCVWCVCVLRTNRMQQRSIWIIVIVVYFRVLSSPRLVAKPKLMSLIYLTIQTYLGGR